MNGEFAAKVAAQQKSFGERERHLREQQTQLEQAWLSLDSELAKRLAEEKAKLIAAARQQAQGQISVEIQDLRHQLAEREQKLVEAQQAELALRKQQRELAAQKQALELEVARQIDRERAAIAEQAKAQATEEQRLRLSEKEKLIADLQKQIDVLKQKAGQGSVQLQGEVLELDLESRLRDQFSADALESVAKGQRGADVLQRVRTNTGHDCGVILWEAKRAKNWSGGWIAKLKEDQREAKAELAALISQTLPQDVRGFGFVDGVWVCDFNSMIPLAVALRQGLVSAAMARVSEVGRQGKMEQLYQFLTSIEFRQRVEGVVEAFKTMREDLEAEKRALTKHWGRREKQLDQAVGHTAMLYGSVQGIVGHNALPDIVPLQLEEPYPEGNS
jgi:hypothetical protein